MKKLFTLFLLQLVLSSGLWAYSYLYITDPHNFGYSDSASISEAILSIKPNGLYVEYSLYLTFREHSLKFKDTTQLELTMNFDLPQNSFITDSWLWVNDSIIKGELLDVWTASSIYEGIVKRRRDPSILRKNYGDNYYLRVYPVKPDSTRKIKITYQAPLRWNSNGTVAVALPIGMLKASKILPSLKMIFYPDKMFKSFTIPQLPELVPNTGKQEGKDIFFTEIPAAKIKDGIEMLMNSPLENGVFCSTQIHNGEKFYQVVVKPDEALNIKPQRKVNFLIDISKYFYTTRWYQDLSKYDTIYYNNRLNYYLNYRSYYIYEKQPSTINGPSIINQMRQSINTYFTSSDSFNFIVANNDKIFRLSNSWLKADSINLSLAFSKILASDFMCDTTYTEKLLLDGIDFMNKNGLDGQIVLFTNTTSFTSDSISNLALSNIKAKMKTIYPIFINDYSNYSWIYLRNIYYNVNSNFFNTLSRYTGGKYRPSYYYSDDHNTVFMDQAIKDLSSNITSLDFYATTANGYAYSKYNLGDGIYYPATPIVQIGKFNGDMPLNITITGEYKNEIFYKKISITNDITDSTNSYDIYKTWTAAKLKSLENQSYDNNAIHAMIDFSKKNRILCNYTAFLCLEPSDTIHNCKDCEQQDESDVFKQGVMSSNGINYYSPGGTMSTELTPKVETVENISIEASPNPFVSTLKIYISIPETVNKEKIIIEIYDMFGKLIKNIMLPEMCSGNSTEIIWDGTDSYGNNIPAGLYFIKIKDKTIKIIKM